MLQFQLSPQDDFLLVRLAGLVSPPAWQQALAALEHAIKGARSDRLLINLEGLVGWLGEPERRQVGALMAAHLSQMKKVVLVIEANKITGVVEAEAKRNGLELRLFPHHGDAVDWVLS